MNSTTKTLTLPDEAWAVLEQQAQKAGMTVPIYLHSKILSCQETPTRLSDALRVIAEDLWNSRLTDAEVQSLVKHHPAVIQAHRENQAQNPRYLRRV